MIIQLKPKYTQIFNTDIYNKYIYIKTNKFH